MKYKILQLKDIRNSDYAFESWKWAKDHFKVEDYQVVYEGQIEPEDPTREVHVTNYLEDLFYKFNMEHPEDFSGHSLSVSDLVELDGKLYYCDSAGWQEIKD